MTNAEKLAKDTGLLASYMVDSISCSECPVTSCALADNCMTALKKWLESEVEEDD